MFSSLFRTYPIKDWTALLEDVTRNINDTYHDSIKGTPSEIHTPLDDVNIFDRINWESSQPTWQKQKENIEKAKKNSKIIQVGDLVYCNVTNPKRLQKGYDIQVSTSTEGDIIIVFFMELHVYSKKVL